MPRPKLAYAEVMAIRCLERIRIADPSEYPMEALAGALHVGVRNGVIHGSQGRLVRGTAESIVVVSTSLTHEASRRFVIAHELGHHQLHTTRSQLAMCTEEGFVPSYREPNGPEAEASCFGRAFLMPASIARPICTAGQPDFDTIRALSARFKTSLTASSLRFLQLTEERCAVVFSRRGQVRWFSTSPDFEHWVTKDFALDERTHAYDAARRKSVPQEPSLVSASAWLSGRTLDDDDDINEESIFMPSYDAVLSLLWIPASAKY